MNNGKWGERETTDHLNQTIPKVKSQQFRKNKFKYLIQFPIISVVISIFTLFVLYRDSCRPGWFQTPCVASCWWPWSSRTPVSAYQVLGLPGCTTTPFIQGSMHCRQRLYQLSFPSPVEAILVNSISQRTCSVQLQGTRSEIFLCFSFLLTLNYSEDTLHSKQVHHGYPPATFVSLLVLKICSSPVGLLLVISQLVSYLGMTMLSFFLPTS